MRFGSCNLFNQGFVNAQCFDFDINKDREGKGIVCGCRHAAIINVRTVSERAGGGRRGPAELFLLFACLVGLINVRCVQIYSFPDGLFCCWARRMMQSSTNLMKTLASMPREYCDGAPFALPADNG